MTMTNSDAAPRAERLTHYLVNFVGQGTPADANTVALELGKGLAAAGVDLVSASTYITPLGADPHKLGLKDNWSRISGYEREEFVARWPELATVLDLLSSGASQT